MNDAYISFGIKQALTITVIYILMAIPVNASIQFEWRLQPQNVQVYVAQQNTNIQVVDVLDYNSPSLYETYAYTRMNVENMQVYSIDIKIKRGYEHTLTHEVGHCISNYQGIPYYWCNTPTFDGIWQAERANNIMMYQGRDNKIEYFACAYDMYIRFNHVLRQSNPMTYEYIKNILKCI